MFTDQDLNAIIFLLNRRTRFETLEEAKAATAIEQHALLALKDRADATKAETEEKKEAPVTEE